MKLIELLKLIPPLTQILIKIPEGWTFRFTVKQILYDYTRYHDYIIKSVEPKESTFFIVLTEGTTCQTGDL